MTPQTAAWVSRHAWTAAVRAEAKKPGTALHPQCACLRGFLAAPCHPAGDCTECAAEPLYEAEAVLIGARGWVPDRAAPRRAGAHAVWVWLADRTCRLRCSHACHRPVPRGGR